MIVSKEHKVVQSVVEKIICNKCGCDVEPLDYHVSVEYSGGYDSKGAIGDGDTFSFELCEACLAELMLSFKIPPAYTNYLFFEQGETWPVFREKNGISVPEKHAD